jgi:hypothetical protein
MTDIVERLRDLARIMVAGAHLDEAADEIERLRNKLDAAEQDVALAELRAALEQHELKR